MRVFVFPHNLLGGVRHLDDAGVYGAFAVLEGAVVENEDAAVVKLASIILLCASLRVEVLDQVAGFAGDDNDYGDISERGNVSILQWVRGVDEKPVVSGVVWSGLEDLWVEIVDDFP